MIRRILLGLTISGLVIGGVSLLLYERPIDSSMSEAEQPRVYAASFAESVKPMRAQVESGLPVVTPVVLTNDSGAVTLPPPLDASAFAPLADTVISEDDRNDLNLYLEEAATYVQESDWEGAAEMYNRALAIAPTNPVATNGLRNAQIRMREVESKEY